MTASTVYEEIQSGHNDSHCWKFSLSHPAICTKRFKELLLDRFMFDSLAVFKAGEDMKWITGGLLKTKSILPAAINDPHLATSVAFTLITPEAFQKLKKMTVAKVFFKGFPHFATKADVVSLFEPFGKVGYVYFMCESKSGKSPYKMGYVIFDDYRSVDALINHGFALSYHKYKITYDEYKSNKKVNKKAAEMANVESKKLVDELTKIKTKSEKEIAQQKHDYKALQKEVEAKARVVEVKLEEEMKMKNEFELMKNRVILRN